MTLRVSPRLAAIPTYEPGLTTREVLARYGLDVAVKLASNESPYEPLPEVEAVVRAGADGLTATRTPTRESCAAPSPSATASTSSRWSSATARAS
jgi:histidinol-phosphate/aromatic aminotransferase/cobyric acid decarboxylase-like protein